MSNEVHPFERAGLGQAPFRYVEMAQQDICYGERILNRAELQEGGIAVTTKPGGSCAYCGTYIRHMYNIRSADGRVFHVGSDCVEKTGDAKLVNAVKVQVRKDAKAKRVATAEAQRLELEALVADDMVRAELVCHPHPKCSSLTLLDWAEWMSKRGGVGGRLRALKAIKAVEVK